MDPASSIPRPSGLPRPASSRLPVLRPSGSQSQLRAPASTEQLRKKPSISSIARLPPPASALQKKSSRASLVRSNTPLASVNANPVPNRASVSTSRRASGIPSFGLPRAAVSSSTAGNEAPGFKRPLARPPSHQSRVPPLSTPTSNTSTEEDTLGSLDAFRSASRASSRAGSRAGFHEDGPEPESAIEIDPSPATSPKKKSRPSLSERTVDSLAHLPSSPAATKTRRRSSFFNADNSMGPPLRPASAMSSNSSRPTTSDGPPQLIPATPKKFGLAASRLSMTVPGKRTVSASVATPTATPTRPTPTSRPVSTIKKPQTPASNLQSTPRPRPLSESKSLTMRTPKPRPSVAGIFGQAISPPGTAKAAPATPSYGRKLLPKKTPDTSRKVSTSSVALRDQIIKAKASQTTDEETPAASPSQKSASSSNALREQIAKAREAAKRTKVEPTRTSTPPRDAIVPDPVEIASFDFGLADPFNQGSKGAKSLLRKRLDGARIDGRMNLAAMGLTEIPDDVLTMYTYDPKDTTVAWGEIVDLSVMILADNELEILPDAMFPDVNYEDMIDSDEAGPQFGGVQSLDLHGNTLRDLPIGLGRLSQLSKLNLSRNKLTMGVLDIIARLPELRELKLAENELQGDLSVALCSLTALEILDIQSNKISTIPSEMSALTQLRSLNVSDNQLRDIPMELFKSTSLVEFQASKNKLEGSLFSVGSVLHLQELHVANNSLTSLCEANAIEFPTLKTLNISSNRLTSLPQVSSWTVLSTLLMSGNKLAKLPEGFIDLMQLRTADFTGNDITQLDEKIALMASLEHFTLAANPLSVRKFLTMNTEDIKRDLATRLQPIDIPDADQEREFENGTTEDSAVSKWQPAPSGTLDISGQNMSEIEEGSLEPFVEDIRQLHLQLNAFANIPTILSHITHLTVLDLSKNNIEIPVSSPLQLLKLRDLRLGGNKLKSLDSLTMHLTAPVLQTLDVSHNRLSSALPILHTFYPELITFLASDNSITDVSADALTGLKIVNLSNNDIERLEPRIGLLQGTLTAFQVEGNKFRVPSWQVLGKGTDAVLTWLKDKIPRESWKSDGTEFFDADDGASF